ncbi:MAG: hypothetical protein JWN56_1097 [Sphingobacteriales bacterium]|nr:hypothetical protein [Sphingobacteriales bacterium]
MKQVFYKGRFIFIPIAAISFLSLISYVVMQLWNHLLPEILHVNTIDFWQAMGLFILCKILFGFGGGGGKMGPPWARGRMAERFKNMTPLEKEKFKEKMQRWKCGPSYNWDSEPTPEPKTNTENPI